MLQQSFCHPGESLRMSPINFNSGFQWVQPVADWVQGINGIEEDSCLLHDGQEAEKEVDSN